MRKNSKYSVGDLVKFKEGLYADEAGAVYRVLEINKDRCFIELVNTGLTFPPQSVAILSELKILVKKQK